MKHALWCGFINSGIFAMRPSGRASDALREISITTGFARHAEGSCLIRMGGTEVLCAASVEARVPPFLRGAGLGWVTGEYGMLPRATHTRGDREAARGKQSGRTQEIQRLIGRSLRAVIDRSVLGEMTITVDCDVLNADGGTRCASVTGAWVALALALAHLRRMNVIKGDPLTGQVAAVSCGIVGGVAQLDLDYEEDSSADADANFVLTAPGDAAPGRIVEIQGTAEKTPFTDAQFAELMHLARLGTSRLFDLQRSALASAA
jgi:ribonuclease PH